MLFGLVLVPLVLGAWSVAHFRTPVSFPPDAVATLLAARVWAGGHPEAVYHEGRALVAERAHPRWLAEAANLGGPVSATAFIESPVYLALMRPLAEALGVRPFLWALALGNAAAALVLGYQSARLLTPVSRPARWWIALAVAMSFPASYGAVLGQTATVAAALVLTGFGLIASGGPRQWPGLGLVLLACAFKPWCVLFLVVLPLARQWRASLWAGAAYGVLLWLAPMLLLPDELWRGYDTMNARMSTLAQINVDDVSLRSVLARLSWPDWPRAAAGWHPLHKVTPLARGVETSLAVLVGLAFAWLVWIRRPSVLHAGVCAMAVVLALLGRCWSDLLVFALPLVLLVIADRDSPTWLAGIGWVLALWLANLLVSFSPRPDDLNPAWAWAVALGAPVPLAAALAILWLWHLPDPALGGDVDPDGAALAS